MIGGTSDESGLVCGFCFVLFFVVVVVGGGFLKTNLFFSEGCWSWSVELYSCV